MTDELVPLSEREIEVLNLVATGASNQDIARELVISVNTVKVHLRNIFEKLGVQSRTEATLYAIRCGLVDVDGAEPDSVDAGDRHAPAHADEEIGLQRSVPAKAVPEIKLWQRLFLGAVLLAGVVLLLLPVFQGKDPATLPANPISDRSGADTTTSAWVATSRWAKAADLPLARARLALVAHDGALYAIGGDQTAGVTGRVDAYFRKNDSWATLAPKPVPVSNIGAAVVGGRLYVPGGCTSAGGVTQQLEVYDPGHGSWGQAASLPVGLCAYSLAVVDDQIFLFGGWDGRRFVDTVLVYDLETDSWADRTAMPSPRGFSGAGAVGDVIYVVGGFDGAQELDETLAYDIAEDIWSERAAMSTGRAGLGVAVVSDKVYAIGGGWKNYLATNEHYDPASDSWTMFESPVLGQWRNLGVAALDTEIYAVGGWNGDYMAINEAYRALFRIILPVVK